MQVTSALEIPYAFWSLVQKFVFIEFVSMVSADFYSASCPSVSWAESRLDHVSLDPSG